MTEFVISFVIVFFNVPPSLAQATQTKLNAYPIGPLSLNTPSTWLSNYFQDKLSGHVDLIGIGEVSHGAIEPMEFQTKMIQYLVEEKGFRNIIFERSDFYFIRPMRNYLNDDKIQNNSIEEWSKANGFTVSASENSMKLMSWLKEYNLKHQKDQVQVAGFDLSAEPTFFNYVLNSYILPINPDQAVELSYLFNSVSDTTKLQKLRNWFDTNRKLLNNRFSSSENEWLEFHLRNLENGTKAMLFKEVSRERWTKFRDSAMAINVAQLAKSKKTIILAHNGHLIRNNSGYMGSHLDKAFLSRYYVIITDFSKHATAEVKPENQEDKNKSNFITRSYLSDPTTAAAQMQEKYGIVSGIFEYKQLIDHRILERSNVIDAYGKHLLTPAFKHAFDCLVVFEKLTPGLISKP